MPDDPTVLGPGEGEDGPLSLNSGDSFGDYRIVGRLGAGAMGEVYEAEHSHLGRRCALKVLPAQLSGDVHFRDRFKQEARTLAAMEHSNIVSVQHAGEVEGRFFLVMDLLKPLGPVEGEAMVAQVLASLLQALGYAHDLGIVHRDLKPANLLQGSDGQVKVADFGVARVIGDDFMQTVVQETVARTQMGDAATLLSGGSGQQSSDYVGTLHFMAPEVIEGRQADSRSDLYAVGVMAYEWLTGRKPVGRYRNASELAPNLNKAWDAWLNRLLAVEPEDRFQTAEAALAALPGRRQVASGGSKWLGGAMLLVLILGAGAFAYFIGTRESPDPIGIVEPEEQVEPGVDGTDANDGSNGIYESDGDLVAAPGPVVPPLQRGEPAPDSEPYDSPDSHTSHSPPDPPAAAPTSEAPAVEPVPDPTPIPAATTPNRGQPFALELGGGEVIEFAWLASLEKWVGRYAVTNAEFRRYRPEHDSGSYQGHSLDGDRQPVVRVSYEDAQAFIGRLNEALAGTGTRVRLPRLEEAQALARAGEERTYIWGDTLPPTYGNYADRETVSTFNWRRIDSDFNHRNRYEDGFLVTAPVDESGRNDFGLYGIGGNVWEWTEEVRNGEPIATGASWRTRDPVAMLVNSTRREAAGRRSGFDDIGFRLILEYVR